MSTSPRGGLKLEAAIERFGLAPVVRGARAVDVGASTGGFTEALLRHGAARVTAVDVGHGQLLAKLRADPRVESLERTDWKTLSLSVAPGPFDFFTVDVSFVAARNMLRGLAFRLRDGAVGVVLLKPQFELPSAAVVGGDVSDPGLRKRAIERFRDKAESLGFALRGHIDSPVAGGSGTTEILVHLHFQGRSARLPARGEKKAGPRPSGGKRQVTAIAAASAGSHEWFAVAAPGLEAVVHAEVERLVGVTDATQVPGGVTFAGPLEVGMRANLHLRVATRVLLRLGEGKAREFAQLRRFVAGLPWGAFLPREHPLQVKAAASRSRLYHTGALAETVALGISDCVGKVAAAPEPAGTGEETEGGTDTRVLIRGEQDRWTVSLDASGELLHRRGWRVEVAKASLRETLAAGLLALCEFDPTGPFVDPMCGAGTIVLEACAIAMNRAPGLGRSFAFERWPCFDRGAWDAHLSEARAAIRDRPPAPIYGFDRDLRAVEMARRNAERAGVLAHVRIEQAALGMEAAPAASGLVVCNPPYGRRLGAPREAAAIARDVGRALRERYAGWRAGVVVADARIGKAIGLPVRASHALSNGGIRVRLLRY